MFAVPRRDDDACTRILHAPCFALAVVAPHVCAVECVCRASEMRASGVVATIVFACIKGELYTQHPLDVLEFTVQDTFICSHIVCYTLWSTARRLQRLPTHRCLASFLHLHHHNVAQHCCGHCLQGHVTVGWVPRAHLPLVTECTVGTGILLWTLFGVLWPFSAFSGILWSSSLKFL
jgi:hypothetical protein